jgi:hypothetical protein
MRTDEVQESKQVDCTTDRKTPQHEFLPTSEGPAVRELDTSEGCSNLSISPRGLERIVAQKRDACNAAQ